MSRECHPREFLTVDRESGRLGFLLCYGVVGTVITLVVADGIWIPLVLLAGAVGGGLMAWRMYGYSHLWLEDGVIVQQTPHKLTRILLDEIVEIEVNFVRNVGKQLLIKSPEDYVEITQLDETTEPLRHELGRRLKSERAYGYTRAQRSPSSMQALGL